MAVSHEYRRSTRRCVTVREMKEGPSSRQLLAQMLRSQVWIASNYRSPRPYKRREDLDRYLNLLREAGMPARRSVVDEIPQWLVSPAGSECPVLAKSGSFDASNLRPLLG